MAGLGNKSAAWQTLFVVVLLLAFRVAFDFSSASAFVFHYRDYGQSGIALALFLITVFAVFLFAVIRLLQHQFIAAILLLLAGVVPFALPDIVDRVSWRFHANEATYRQRVAADMSLTPKFDVFDWEDSGSPLTGGGLLKSAVVYDESDNIEKPWKQRPPEWNDLRDRGPVSDFWVTHPVQGMQPCHRTLRKLAEHFFYVADQC